MTGGLKDCFHNKLVYRAKLFSSLGWVPRRPVKRGPIVLHMSLLLKFLKTSRGDYKLIELFGRMGSVQISRNICKSKELGFDQEILYNGFLFPFI